MTLQYLVVFAIRYVLAFDSFLVKGNNEVGNEYFLLRKGRKRKWQRYEALAPFWRQNMAIINQATQTGSFLGVSPCYWWS